MPRSTTLADCETFYRLPPTDMRLILPNVSGSTVLLGEWLLGQLLSKLAWEQGTIDPALHRIWPQVVKMATGVQTQIVLAVTKRRVSRQVNSALTHCTEIQNIPTKRNGSPNKLVAKGKKAKRGSSSGMSYST